MIYEQVVSNVSYSIEKVTVVDGRNASELSIFDRNNIKVADDVYIATFLIWNAGYAGIGKDKIEPGVVTISTPDNERILYHRVITSVPDPGQADSWFTITCPSKSQLAIKFTKFSANAEIKLSITYTGDQDLYVNDEGVFMDVRQLKKVKPETERKIYITNLRNIAVSAGVSSFFVLLILVLAQTAPATDPNDRSIVNRPIAIHISLAQAAPVIIVLIICILAFSGYVISKLTTTLPPA